MLVQEFIAAHACVFEAAIACASSLQKISVRQHDVHRKHKKHTTCILRMLLHVQETVFHGVMTSLSSLLSPTPVHFARFVTFVGGLTMSVSLSL